MARGGGSLLVIMVLLLGTLLVLLHANRALLYETRATANQVRAAQALQAAEAGVAWAVAHLNQPRPLDAACAVASGASAASLAERFIGFDATGAWVPASAASAAGCAAESGLTWRCSCPDAGEPSLGTPALDRWQPAFRVAFSSGPRVGTTWLHAMGCAQLAPACGASSGAPDALAQVDVLLAPLEPLARLPHATLVARGSVMLQDGVVVENSQGLAVASAETVTLAPLARTSGAPGTLPEDTVLSLDPTWRDATGTTVSADRFFAWHFGLNRTRYAALPHVTQLACGSSCTGADLSTAADAGARVLWVPGNLTLASALTLGSATRPVVLVVNGSLSIQAPLTMNGVVYATQVQWLGTTTTQSRLDGALVSEGPVQVSGLVWLRDDPALLQRLRGAGSWATVAGSWNDAR